MPITVNLKGVQTELEVVPAGVYESTVASVTEATSKAGNPMLSVKLRIDAPEDFAGRMLFDNFSLLPQALWRLKRWLLDLGYDPDELEGQIELEPEELVGLEVDVVVVTEMFERKKPDGTMEQVERSRITAYAASGEASMGELFAEADEDADVEFSFD